MEKRIANLANLVEQNNIVSNDPINIARFNAFEEALAIIENREPVLKEEEHVKKVGFNFWDDLRLSLNCLRNYLTIK